MGGIETVVTHEDAAKALGENPKNQAALEAAVILHHNASGESRQATLDAITANIKSEDPKEDGVMNLHKGLDFSDPIVALTRAYEGLQTFSSANDTVEESLTDEKKQMNFEYLGQDPFAAKHGVNGAKIASVLSSLESSKNHGVDNLTLATIAFSAGLSGVPGGDYESVGKLFAKTKGLLEGYENSAYQDTADSMSNEAGLYLSVMRKTGIHGDERVAMYSSLVEQGAKPEEGVAASYGREIALPLEQEHLRFLVTYGEELAERIGEDQVRYQIAEGQRRLQEWTEKDTKYLSGARSAHLEAIRLHELTEDKGYESTIDPAAHADQAKRLTDRILDMFSENPAAQFEVQLGQEEGELLGKYTTGLEPGVHYKKASDAPPPSAADSAAPVDGAQVSAP